MKKNYKIFKKQEKRIVKLMYQKGFLDGSDANISKLWWQDDWDGKYQLFYSEAPNYFGETFEYTVTSLIYENFYWKFRIMPKDNKTNRKKMIKYLKTFKTVHRDSKINKVLKLHREE